MAQKIIAACLLAAAAATLPAIAQMPAEAPGKLDAKRVTAGNYKTDAAHTQVAFAINHLGFNVYHGLFGNVTGTLTLDPAKPAASKVSIDIPMSGIVTTSDRLTTHLKTPDFFDAEKFPTAHFEATQIVAKGNAATITGNLTIKGITKPVVLDARFSGAGKNRNGVDTIGFEASTKLKRGDFGVSYGIPMVGEIVDLQITAAFEKVTA